MATNSMDFRDALHTVARRHCIERHAFWAEAYCHLQANARATMSVDELNWSYTDEAYATFPRYLVWEAILAEVERLEKRSAPTIEESSVTLAGEWLVAKVSPAVP